MRFRILGPLEVWTDGKWQPITADKWRSLLACLLLRAGQIVSTDALMDELWGDEPPAKAKNLISIYVLRLRRLLGDNEGKLLAYRSPGYTLTLAADDLDSTRFEALVGEGRQALADGDPLRAAALLSAGLGLWRGPLLADVTPTPLITTESERAVELRLTATELWAQASIACGRADEVVPQLRRLVGDYPLREGLWGILMRALDAGGRHAEALDAFTQAREVLAEELGVDPGPELRRLHAGLLAADAAPANGTRPRPAAQPAGPREAHGPHGPRTQAPGEPAAPADAIPEGDVPGTIAMGSYTEPEGRIATPAPPPAPADPAIPRPAQLPADIGDFTGREAHVRHLSDMLTRSIAAGSPGAVPIAFVAGAGGLGKTTLAIHAAHQIRDHFPDGQLYADLFGATPQPLPPGDVLARFLRDLGVDGDKVPAGDEERAALYRTRLTGRRVLIVLDNARDTAQVRPLLPGSASCAVLVTTRNRTADLASTRFVDLHVLDDDEALSLFTRILGDERAMAEPEATAEVLVACAGLPLAVRICAARLAARGNWKIATMAHRLRDERRRLDELKLGDLAVRASFRVSYDSLRPLRKGAPATTDPARAFRLLGLWQGPTISLKAALALTGADEDDADDVAEALEGLVDAHLLESPEPDWYRFHDLLRVYATERALAAEAQDDRASATERLLRWYLCTADAAAQVVSPHRYRIPLDPADQDGPAVRFETAEDALSWYDSERANVVAATRQALQAGLHDVAWRLPTALYPLLNRRDNWADAIATHRVALDAVLLAGDRLGEGWVRNNLGFALAKIRDAEAISHLRRALEIRRELADRMGETQTALSLGEAHLQMEGPAAALEPFRQSLAAAQAAGNPSLLAIGLNNLGEVYFSLERLDEAADCFRRALDVPKASVYSVAHATHNLGRVYLELDRPQDAIASLREALRLHERTGDMRGQAVVHSYLGRAYHDAANLPAARESWLRALAIFRLVGEQAETVEVEAALAALPS